MISDYKHDVWWGVAAGALSLMAVFVVPVFVGAEDEGHVATSTAATSTEASPDTAIGTDDGTATSTDNELYARSATSSEERATSTHDTTGTSTKQHTGVSTSLGATSTATTTPPPVVSTSTVQVTVRTEHGVVAEGELTLPTNATSTMITPTAGGDPVAVDAHSALALLVALDASSSAFAITDLAYYASFDSFFLNCVDVPEHLCGYWQYTVNGAYPSIGADKYVLKEGDQVYFFFGSPRLVTLSATSTRTNEPFSATLTQYDPEVGAYVPTGGFVLGVVQDDPENPFTPKEITATSTDELGAATFVIATSGAYAVGIQEDFYFPTVPITVVSSGTSSATSTSPGTAAPTNASPGGGLLNTGDASSNTFDVLGALHYLAAQQEEDGSFGTPLYTDWVAIALASGGGVQESRAKVRAYLVEHPAAYSSATDYERHVMALMALDINPYTGTSIDYIAKLIEYYDGTQVGDPALVNDDIFALIPLRRAGFSEDSAMIQQIVAFVLTKQRSNGSWEGSIDLTAAAIQALAPYADLSGVSVALTKAAQYLKGAQKSDGGFGDSFATSWVLQAIRALGDTVTDWAKHGVSPLEYLASQQVSDGAVGDKDEPPVNRIWATAYAIPAALGKTWHEILATFRIPGSYDHQQSIHTAGSGGGSSATGSAAEATTAATTTRAVTETNTADVVAATNTPPQSPDISISHERLTRAIVEQSTPSVSSIESESESGAPTQSRIAQNRPASPEEEQHSEPVQAVATSVASSTTGDLTDDQVAAVVAADNRLGGVSRILGTLFIVLLAGFAVVSILRTRKL